MALFLYLLFVFVCVVGTKPSDLINRGICDSNGNGMVMSAGQQDSGRYALYFVCITVAIFSVRGVHILLS